MKGGHLERPITIQRYYTAIRRNQQGESNSITNQKQLLESYAKRNGFVNIYHYTDDGVSGTTFDREGFQKMIKAVEENKVSTVIVKDMSRFGRDYLKVGFYTEILFKEKGVRFIAINNGIDSEKQAESDFTPFLNIMNEWYARDTSRKIQSIFRARMEEGKRVFPSVPYGYYRNPKNKQELLVDKESAKVVKLNWLQEKQQNLFLISCGARLAPFDIQELRDLMSEDELELDTLGDRKTALFVIISDTDEPR